MVKFQTGELRQFLDDRRSSALRALTAVSETDFLADPDGCVERIYDEYTFAQLEVSDIDGVQSEGTKAGRLTGYDSFEHRAYQYDGIQISIRIPFTGPGELWRYQPSSRLIGAVHADALELRDGHFLFVRGGHSLEPDWVRSELTQAIQQVKQIGGWINGDVQQWLRQLRVDLEAAARDRQARLASVSALDEALGIPIAATAPEKQIPIPVKKSPLQRTSSPVAGETRPPAQHRVLQDEVYQDVLRTIEQMSRAMERTPTAAKLKDEELRNLILIVLNANYEGAVRGEVFNGKGKTDLLLNWEGDNAFIGECKIWTGPAKLREAIDQLLGYVTWRDTKAALIVFIKKGTPSDVIRKARNEVEAHASVVRLKAEVSETRFDCVLQSPGDTERHIDLSLIAVVIPES
jgi:hypothetical protein